MKKIDKANRPQPSKKLQLQRETVRRLETPELANIRGGASVPQTYPTFTRDDI